MNRSGSASFLILLLSLIVLSACSAVKIVDAKKASSLKSGDYSTYNFYKLDIDNQSPLEPEKANLELLLQEIGDKMEANNYRRTKNPDLLINIGIVITEEEQTRETDLRDAPSYIGQRNYSWKSEEVVIGYYNQGTVAFDFVDTKSNSLVYHAAARSILHKKPEKNRKQIQDAVDKIFDRMGL